MRHRSSTVRIYALCILLLLGAAAAWTARADEPARDAPPPTRIRDLDYGDVLFHFFQDDYFEAIVRLEANRDFNRLTHHAAEAELLSGGLYLSLGLHTEAERIFDRLLAGPVAPSVRDRARFYLARIGYQRGYYEAALRNLGLIEQPLAGKLEPERRLLEANVLMSLGRYAEAAERLASWPRAATTGTCAGPASPTAGGGTGWSPRSATSACTGCPRACTPWSTCPTTAPRSRRSPRPSGADWPFRASTEYAFAPGHAPALVVGYATPPAHAFTSAVARLVATLSRSGGPTARPRP